MQAMVSASMGIGVLVPSLPGSSKPAVKSAIVHERRQPESAPAKAGPFAAARANEQRLARLLGQHHAVVWRTLRRVGVDERRVDDATQEVFIIASRKLERIETGKERRFLLSAAIKVAANYRRSSQSRRELLDDSSLVEHHDPRPSPEQLLDQKKLRQTLDAVLERLPDELRTVFVLFELEGMSVPEISELTETKTGTVSSRLRRARELFLKSVTCLKARGVIEGGAR